MNPETDERAQLTADVDLDLKMFMLAAVPPSWAASDDAAPLASGQTLARTRLAGAFEKLRFEAHHEAAIGTAAPSTSSLGGSNVVGLPPAQGVDLSWDAAQGDGLLVSGRLDRLWLAEDVGRFSATIGRQAVSFGTGLVFSPMDVVNPFGAATIDTEYRPGVDAVRADLFAGTAGKASLVAAWVGSAPATDGQEVGLPDAVMAASCRGTVGVTDVIGLAAVSRGDAVFGLGFASNVGVVGLHGEATVTQPAAEVNDGVFGRVVVGADGRPTSKTTLSAEAYLQTLGAVDPSDYLAEATSERVLRGELWTLGVGYGVVSVAQELTSLVSITGSVISNVIDPSALISASLSASVADNTSLGIGGFQPIGRAPDSDGSVRTEFGLYPSVFFIHMKAWL